MQSIELLAQQKNGNDIERTYVSRTRGRLYVVIYLSTMEPTKINWLFVQDFSKSIKLCIRVGLLAF